MNFLQLCQRVARESGTVSGESQPSSVENQTGKLSKIVNWTSNAWLEIQNDRGGWRWMRKEFSGKPLTAGTARYTAAALGINDLADWITDHKCGYYPLSIYKQSSGVADEQPLREISWEQWRNRYGRGQQTQNRPVDYAISPANEICFGPVPDATYVVAGEYRKTPQVLTENGDVPEMPERFHMLIVWRALIRLHEYDEAPALPIASVTKDHNRILEDLERDQLLGFNLRLGGEPLA